MNPRPGELLDLSPAKWIWVPVERTLPGTVALFRREIALDAVPMSAPGFLFADSRYRLWVNGKRVQWGPAPFDPRRGEADPVELAPFLVAGANVVGIEVLYYGQGDGTWPMGKPGLIARFDIGGATVVTDREWRVALDRGHRAGRAKRSFLRALQEEFDARDHPVGWTAPGFAPADGWRPSRELNLPPTKTTFSGWHASYQDDFYAPAETKTEMRSRSVPLMREDFIAAKPSEEGEIFWRGSPDDWFDFRLADSFTLDPASGGVKGRYWTFVLPHEHVGWPSFEVKAPSGTVLEIIVQESRDPANPWLDTHHYTWSRHVCRGGWEAIEPFDYEAFRYLQIHARDGEAKVEIRRPGIRRRRMAYPAEPQIATDDAALQSVFDAAIRTVENSAQDVVVDGMGRERQQYSGDGGHQLHAVRSAFGGAAVSARFLRTFGLGQTHSGVWLDSWPACDRLSRLSQRELGASGWGPLIDHSIGFVLDHYHHWMQSGDEEPTRENWAAIESFLAFLRTHAKDGIVPADGYGIEAVWMDHEAFRSQSEKGLALNLYRRHMLRRALRMAEGLDLAGRQGLRRDFEASDAALRTRIARNGLRNNLDASGEAPRYDDRSLATFLLDAEPQEDRVGEALDLLSRMPADVGRSYPANAVWRHWALARHGRMDLVLQEYRERWATMHSVITNGTIQEFWNVRPGTPDLMSHCAVSPIILAHQGIVGLEPLEPGYAKYVLRPQLAGLKKFETTVHVPTGAVHLSAAPDPERPGEYEVRILTPRYGEGAVVIGGERRDLRPGALSVVRWMP